MMFLSQSDKIGQKPEILNKIKRYLILLKNMVKDLTISDNIKE